VDGKPKVASKSVGKQRAAQKTLSAPRLLDCLKISYFELCEELSPEIQSRRPLHRICSVMRRRKARWLVLHRHLELAPYFAREFPAAHMESEHLRRIVPGADVEIVQLSFFRPCSHASMRRVLQRKKQNGGVRPKLLGSCLLVIARQSIKRTAPPEALPSPYVLEALVAIPELSQSRTVRSGRSNVTSIAPSADGVSSHVHVFSRSQVCVAGRPFIIDASYYCQQNGITSSCAHCCLRSALWQLGLGPSKGHREQISTDALNNVAKQAMEKVEPAREFDPRNGLTREEIEAICNHFGAEVFRVEYDTAPQPYFAHSAYEMAYLLAESGLPTLLLFKTRDVADGSDSRHVVPVVGHTFNSDAWLLAALRRYDHLPQTALVTAFRHKQHLSTVEWAPQLILHDDLLGPYYNVGPDVLTRPLDPRDNGLGRVGTVMAIVPRNSGWAKSPALAQQAGRLLLDSVYSLHQKSMPEKWRRRLDERWGINGNTNQRNKDLVLRTQLVRKSDYVRHIECQRDHLGQASGLSKTHVAAVSQAFERETNSCVWLVEITIPELFTANVGKVGEMILPLEHADGGIVAEKIATIKSGEVIESPPLASRFFGSLITYETGGYFTRHALKYRSHTPLFVRGIDATGW
jgi:hypothetical protein